MNKLSQIGLILSIIFINTYSLNAQQSVGDISITSGIGAGSFLMNSAVLNMTVPPLTIATDYGFNDEHGPGLICIGGFYSYTSIKEEYFFPIVGAKGYKFDIHTLGVRATYRYKLIDKLDIYGGVLLGYYFADKTFYNGDESLWTNNPLIKSNIAYSLYFGGNYQITDLLGAFTEFGYGINNFRIGVSLNF